MKVLKFTKDHSPYVKGEVASFSDADGQVRLDAGVAEEVKHYDRQPDRRVEEKFDDAGRPTGVMESREVPDDLERNVDLPPTAAGRSPKAEENMTDEEKKRLAEFEENDAKSVDAPRVNKMTEAPAKKK